MPASIASCYLSASSALNAGATRFLGPFGGGFGESTPEVWIEMTFAATLRNLHVGTTNGFLNSGGAGSGSTTYTVRVNGVGTALAVAVPFVVAGPSSGSNLVDSVSVNAGDRVSVSFTHSADLNGTANTDITASVEVVTAAGLRSILQWCPDGTSPATAARFPVEYSANSSGITVESFIVVPTVGTLRNLRVGARTDPTGSGQCVYTIRVNGVDTALAVAILHAAAPHAGQNLVNTVAVAAHDRVSLKLTRTALPTTNGADFLTTVEYEQ